MNNWEYFSNTYKVIINNNILDSIFTLLECLFTVSIQIIIFTRQFKYEETINFSPIHFYLIIEKLVNIIPTKIKIMIVSLIYIIILIYFFI